MPVDLLMTFILILMALANKLFFVTSIAIISISIIICGGYVQRHDSIQKNSEER